MSKDLICKELTDHDLNKMFKAISSMFGPIGDTQFAIPIFDSYPMYRDKPLYEKDMKFSYYGNTGQATDHGGIIVVCSCLNEKDKVVHYGIAYCSPKDVYNKDIGREIAYRDMVNNMSTIPYDKKKHHRINACIFADTIAYGQYPSWAEKSIAYALVNHLCNGYY